MALLRGSLIGVVDFMLISCCGSLSENFAGSSFFKQWQISSLQAIAISKRGGRREGTEWLGREKHTLKGNVRGVKARASSWKPIAFHPCNCCKLFRRQIGGSGVVLFLKIKETISLSVDGQPTVDTGPELHM